MKPTLVIVGRPNVGKSTLFNRLTRTRDALVADVPGLTRDRHYGLGRLGERPYLVVDTGGLEPEASGGVVEMGKKGRNPHPRKRRNRPRTRAPRGPPTRAPPAGTGLRRAGRPGIV